MKLWLKFTDENGEDQRIRVEGDEFIVGRHSDNDLSIPNGKLSREHIKIQPFAGTFVVTDLGSSNGTTINGEEIKDSVALKNGDRLNLGGGIEIYVEMASDGQDAGEPPPAGADEDPGSDVGGQASGNAAAGTAAGSAGGASNAASNDGGSGIPTSIFYIAPVMGVIILVMLCGVVYLASSGDTKKPDNEDISYTTPIDRDTPPKNGNDPPGNSRSGKTPDDPPPSNNGTTSLDPVDPPPSPTSADPIEAKCEQSGAKFLRQIAVNDPRAFLTGDQAKIISDKVKQIGSSSAIADNINAARRSSSQIKDLASKKDLKPQFLAIAALAKLGTSRGDALKAANDMADALEKLRGPVGGEFANDSLLMIAAYDQVSSGEFKKMPGMLQDLATRSPEGARGVRTIWFLHKNGKISDGEYNFALQFLALGVITQNPKDFGVNAEALVL